MRHGPETRPHSCGVWWVRHGPSTAFDPASVRVTCPEGGILCFYGEEDHELHQEQSD
jgi:hypothetical protein